MHVEKLKSALRMLPPEGFKGRGPELADLLDRAEEFARATDRPPDHVSLITELESKQELLGCLVRVHPASGVVVVLTGPLAMSERERDHECRRAWKADKNLEVEFGTFTRFVSYRRAVDAGRVPDLPAPKREDPKPEPVNFVEIDPNLPLRDRCAARWAGEPQTRREFLGNFERFVAFESASERNLVRVRV